MADEITLPIGATAEPDTCGSCKFFQRWTDRGASYQHTGLCKIVMPPPKERFERKNLNDDDNAEYRAPNDVDDTHRCDLHRPSGKTFIVQRRVLPTR
jgi:hypothetical protein